MRHLKFVICAVVTTVFVWLLIQAMALISMFANVIKAMMEKSVKNKFVLAPQNHAMPLMDTAKGQLCKTRPIGKHRLFPNYFWNMEC